MSERVLWAKLIEHAKRFDSKEAAEDALARVGETVYGRKVLKKRVGGVMAKGREHPIVVVEVDDGRMFFLESDGTD